MAASLMLRMGPMVCLPDDYSSTEYRRSYDSSPSPRPSVPHSVKSQGEVVNTAAAYQPHRGAKEHLLREVVDGEAGRKGYDEDVDTPCSTASTHQSDIQAAPCVLQEGLDRPQRQNDESDDGKAEDVRAPNDNDVLGELNGIVRPSSPNIFLSRALSDAKTSSGSETESDEDDLAFVGKVDHHREPKDSSVTAYSGSDEERSEASDSETSSSDDESSGNEVSCRKEDSSDDEEECPHGGTWSMEEERPREGTRLTEDDDFFDPARINSILKESQIFDSDDESDESDTDSDDSDELSSDSDFDFEMDDDDGGDLSASPNGQDAYDGERRWTRPGPSPLRQVFSASDATEMALESGGDDKMPRNKPLTIWAIERGDREVDDRDWRLNVLLSLHLRKTDPPKQLDSVPGQDGSNHGRRPERLFIGQGTPAKRVEATLASPPSRYTYRIEAGEYQGRTFDRDAFHGPTAWARFVRFKTVNATMNQRTTKLEFAIRFGEKDDEAVVYTDSEALTFWQTCRDELVVKSQRLKEPEERGRKDN